MIVWGSGGGGGDLGVVETKRCQTCDNERPFKLMLQYRYWHVYNLRGLTSKKYLMVCDVCHYGRELDAAGVERNFEKHPIPFMTRNGWMFLLVLGALVVGLMVIGMVSPPRPR